MTPDELEMIREYVSKFQVDDTQWYLARDLLDEVDRLRAQNGDLLQQINTDSDVMYLQRREIDHWKARAGD